MSTLTFTKEKNRTILIVDDEQPMQELLQLYLSNDGYHTETAVDGEMAMSLLSYTKYDLVILDLMMPKLDGFDVCKAIRNVSNVPIIMLTAREDTIDKVVGLKLGADDYMTKPFEQQELLARMESIFRREKYLQEDFPVANQPIVSNQKIDYFYEDLRMNIQTHQVFYMDGELSLTPKEFAILRLFLSNKGRIFHREDILELLWKNRPVNDDRTVDTHIKNLRDKLSQAGIPGQDVIKTVWGTGYICNETT
ncbi:MAG: response regulator transcription factor [Paenibacillus sp.]|nr:response regulator transcription factor [Paenibacillus sp.]